MKTHIEKYDNVEVEFSEFVPTERDKNFMEALENIESVVGIKRICQNC